MPEEVKERREQRGPLRAPQAEHPCRRGAARAQPQKAGLASSEEDTARWHIDSATNEHARTGEIPEPGVSTALTEADGREHIRLPIGSRRLEEERQERRRRLSTQQEQQWRSRSSCRQAGARSAETSMFLDGTSHRDAGGAWKSLALCAPTRTRRPRCGLRASRAGV